MGRQHFSRLCNATVTGVAAASVILGGGVARAQTGQAQTQLAFSYECANHFVVRNDGIAAADVEYGVASSERTPVHLNPRDAVTIESASSAPMELWVNGRRVSTEPKGNKTCASQNRVDVVVRPLDPAATSNADVGAVSNDVGIASAGYDANYVIEPQQTRVVYVTAPSRYYAPYYAPYYGFDPYYYGYPGYTGFGYYGYRAPILSLNVPFRSTRGYRGGVGGVYRAPARRSGGHLTGRTAVHR
jgi:hypothetical protein